MKLPKTFLAVNLSDAFSFQEKPQAGDEVIEADPEPETTPQAEPSKEGEQEASKPADADVVPADTADTATIDDAATDEQSDVLEIKIPEDQHARAVEAEGDGDNADSVAVTESAEASGGVSPLPEMEAAPPLATVAPQTTTEQQEQSKKGPEDTPMA